MGKQAIKRLSRIREVTMAKVKEKCMRNRSRSGLRFRKEEARGPHPIVVPTEERKKEHGRVIPVGNNQGIKYKMIETGINGEQEMQEVQWRGNVRNQGKRARLVL